MMATVISPTDRRVIIEGVSWATYERLLIDFGDSHIARVAFDRGTLEIMAPPFAHERPAHLLVQIVGILAEVRDLDLIGVGSTTFKRERVEGRSWSSRKFWSKPSHSCNAKAGFRMAP